MYVTLIVFFFECYGDHRDLHSFPTRRSSDLESAVLGIGGGVLGFGLAQVLLSVFLRLAPAGLPRLDIDRKSTRLNSSHRCISYAVFCLKKKNKSKALTYHEPNFCNCTNVISI